MRSSKRAKNRPGRWYLYVLKCCDNTLYTGVTNDLPRRLAQHNNGTASRYTRSRLPVKIIYQEACRGRSSALKKECRMKALARREKEEYIRAKTPDSRRSLRRHARTRAE